MPLASSRSAAEKRAEMVEKEKKEQQRWQKQQQPHQPPPQRRLSSSLPATCASTTAVNAAKARRRLSSMARQNSSSSLTSLLGSVKENEQPGSGPKKEPSRQPQHKRHSSAPPISPSQGPTPYWKVAAERGMSPPETRSATKKPRREEEDDEGHGGAGIAGAVLLFSPPDQIANARREERERMARAADRNRRVTKARDSGQLLVYSPSNRPLPLPMEASESPASDPNEGIPVNAPAESKKKDPSEERLGADRGSTTTSGPNSNEETTVLLKQLLEQVQQSDGRHVTRDQLLELQTANNSKFEQQNDRLQAELKHVSEQWRSDKEEFLVRKTRLEFELEAARQQIEALRRLEQQVRDLQSDNSTQLLLVRSLEERLAATAADLRDYKSQVSALRSRHEAEVKQLAEANRQLERNATNVSGEMQQLAASRDELSKKVDEYERVISQQEAVVEDLREQLDRVTTLLKSKEATLSSIQEASTGHESTIVELKDEIERLSGALGDLQSASSIRQTESQEQLDALTKELEDKNAAIGNLFRQLGEKQKELQSVSEDWNLAKVTAGDIEAKLQLQVGELNSSLEEAMRELEAYDAVKLDLQERLQAAHDRIESELRLREEQEAKLESVRAELEEARSDLVRVQVEREEAQRNWQEQSKDKSETSTQLLSMQESYRELENRYKESEKVQSLKIVELESKNRHLKLQIKESTRERDEARSNMLGFNDRESELYRKLQESDRIRRELHSRVMQLTGNIRVYVRVRPHLPGEASAPEPARAAKDGKKRGREEGSSPFSFPGVYDREAKSSRGSGAEDSTKNVVVVTEPAKDRGGLSDRRMTWKFGFDNVFSPHHGQDDVWEATSPLVQSAIDGYNVTIFAYGQTGSGKTYTMLGDDRNPGIVGRAVAKLFQAKHEIESMSRGDAAVEISVELLEIYNEKVSDLLDPESPVNRNHRSLKVVSKEVVGNVVVNTKTDSEVLELVALAQDRRCVKATASNTESSRSHMLFTISFSVTSNDGSTRNGKLNICDLAGSERLSKSGTHVVGGSLLEETKNINKSLSVLSNVIEKLQAGEKTIPYRESKLTMLLENSLSGNSKTLAIVCCNPLWSHYQESLCSLRFAEKVNKVELKAVSSFAF